MSKQKQRSLALNSSDIDLVIVACRAMADRLRSNMALVDTGPHMRRLSRTSEDSFRRLADRLDRLRSAADALKIQVRLPTEPSNGNEDRDTHVSS